MPSRPGCECCEDLPPGLPCVCCSKALTPAQAIHAAVVANLEADGSKAKIKAVAVLVGDSPGSWGRYVSTNRDAGGKKVGRWLDALDAAGHPMRLKWEAGVWTCEPVTS